MRNAAIIGVGCSRIGELWSKSIKDLLTESALKAMDEARVNKVDSVYVANAASNLLQGQGNLGAFTLDALGLSDIPAVRIEAACASGGLAVYNAVKDVRSGAANTVLVLGVEKMMDALPEDAMAAMMMGEDQEYTAYSGISFVGLQALMARVYTDKFEVPPEQLAAFSVNAHKNAVNNPNAQFHNEIDIDDVIRSALVADPIRMLECSSLSDGAASLVICSEEIAKNHPDSPIQVAGSAVASDFFSIADRDDFLSFKATRLAAEKAFKQANLTTREIEILEVHDSTSFTGVLALEDLGFAEKGKGAAFVADGGVDINGKYPTNTLGGLKGRGHPVGATGIYQIIDLVTQLRGKAGKNQVSDAKIGLSQNTAGLGSTVTVHILRRAV